jgi:hypothetical protein
MVDSAPRLPQQRCRAREQECRQQMHGDEGANSVGGMIESYSTGAISLTEIEIDHEIGKYK